jgi:hypothetical protein
MPLVVIENAKPPVQSSSDIDKDSGHQKGLCATWWA